VTGAAPNPGGARFLGDLESSVGAAVVGAELPLRLMATAVLAAGHALVEDVPGVGKTLLARAFSKALGLTFARVQGTPDLLEPLSQFFQQALARAFKEAEGLLLSSVCLERFDLPGKRVGGGMRLLEPCQLTPEHGVRGLQGIIPSAELALPRIRRQLEGSVLPHRSLQRGEPFPVIPLPLITQRQH